MREEISEPQHWRSATKNGSTRGTRRLRVELPAEALDAALEQQTTSVDTAADFRRDAGDNAASEKMSVTPDIIQGLANQLAMLEAQREQIQKLLDEAQG